jgi:hypothetical protein
VERSEQSAEAVVARDALAGTAGRRQPEARRAQTREGRNGRESQVPDLERLGTRSLRQSAERPEEGSGEA